MFILVHGLKIGAKGVHLPTHIPALMQLVIFLERVHSIGRLELETR